MDDLDVLKEYSERLGSKLEERNLELQQSTDAREASEKRYRDLVELSPDAIFIQCDGDFVFMNGRAALMFGASGTNALVGKPVIQSFHPSSRSFFKDLIKELHQPNRTVAAHEVELSRTDGSVCEVELAAASLTVDGKGAAQIVVRDISERKRAQRAAEECQARFRQLTAAISEVFWLSDKDLSKLLYVSPAYYKVWGRSCESLTEAPMALFQTTHPGDRERVIAALQKQKHGEPTDEEFRIVRPDGSVRWVRSRTYPVLDADDQFYRVAGIADDISDRKRAEEELRLTNEKLNQLRAHSLIVI